MRKIAFLALLGCGCAATEEASVPKTADVVSGKPDPALVGKWATADDGVRLALDASGTGTMHSEAKTNRGNFKYDVQGTWSVQGDKFAFVRKDEQIERYHWKRDGAALILSRSFPKVMLRLEKK